MTFDGMIDQALNHPDIGPAIAEDLRGIGVHEPTDLTGKGPLELYNLLNSTTGERHDPCVLDVFMSQSSL
jgi:Pathogenicity locus